MALKLSHLYIQCFLVFQIQFMVANSRTLESNVQSFNFLKSPEGSQKGQTTKELTNFFTALVNYPKSRQAGKNLTNDNFGDFLESGVKAYQLNIAGNLDSDTIEEMKHPRSGVVDPVDHPSRPTRKRHGRKSGGLHLVSKYTLTSFTWPPTKTNLTYSFLDDVRIKAINLTTLKAACSRGFQKWAAVSVFNFKETTNNCKGDLTIGFERGDHGEVNFTGIGPLAFSYYPTDGRSYYNADVPWSATSPTPDEYDLESVITHEFGHLLGLNHSTDKDAVMYRSLPPGTVKRDLTQDDINAIKALYPY